VKQNGYKVNNLDCTVCLEEPKIAQYIAEMRSTISSILEIQPDEVAIKATTTEKLGFTGRGEGIIAISIVLLT
jgi:2-C-methyl-D-erythritol 2,4-cyclodiphosphate synthase